ncbi:hypothetical protein TPR58_03595 [Sphingomonas sp. HF-S3]|uniref:Lipoprotein n=1 Tax=Sphingomonas rustica TaxID=3103142 RepID=A0ABV0B3T2_9SPHN
MANRMTFGWYRMPIRRAYAAILCGFAFSLASCGNISRSDRDALQIVKSGAAKRLIQQRFDTHPQCAQVLVTDSNGLMRAAPDTPAARALLAAKLIIMDPRPGPANSNDKFFMPAPAARRWFSLTSAERTALPMHLLCFARREVTSVWIDASGSLPIYRYGFRLVDPAPWLVDPAIRKAFPAVRASFGVEFLGDEYLHVRDGHLDIKMLKPTNFHSAIIAYQVSFTDFVID